MLCDELKVYVPQDGPYGLEPEEGGKLVEEETCYLKSEVDAAIAELKKKLMPCLNGDCILTCEVVEKYGKENAELKAEMESRIPAWRKCSEELPEDGAEVLATDGDGIWLCYKTTMCDGSPWFQPDGLPHIEGVTHWMPLPKPPKEADK